MINSISRTAGFLLIAVSAFASAQTPPPPAPSAQPMHVQGLNVYPKNGQTQDQQWADRYACDNWSKTQSGFDPAQPPAGLPAADLASRKDQYKRAMSACLDAHGYTVTAAAAVAAAAPPPVHPVVVVPAGFRYHSLMMQIEGGYSLTRGDTAKTLNGGWNTGLGLSWYPSSSLPFGLRLDGSYSRFDATSQALGQASQDLRTDVSHGYQDIYGADLDAEFKFALGTHTKWYLFGGGGRYRESTTLQQVNYVPGYACYFYCYPAYFGVASTVAHDTTGWLNSWNAGTGFEFALQDPVRFFVEARYQRIGTNMSEFVPIRVGLRF
jgi:Outer membrane protein beta-barrel domain